VGFVLRSGGLIYPQQHGGSCQLLFFEVPGAVSLIDHQKFLT